MVCRNVYVIEWNRKLSSQCALAPSLNYMLLFAYIRSIIFIFQCNANCILTERKKKEKWLASYSSSACTDSTNSINWIHLFARLDLYFSSQANNCLLYHNTKCYLICICAPVYTYRYGYCWLAWWIAYRSCVSSISCAFQCKNFHICENSSYTHTSKYI